MDELDPAYIAMYWPLIGGTPPPQENTMRCSIDLSDEDHENIDQIRAAIKRAVDDPSCHRANAIGATIQCRTLEGAIKFALATAADEAMRRHP